MVTGSNQVQQVLASVEVWAKTRSVHGLALVGSYARGQARGDSEIDHVVLVDDPALFREVAWLDEIDWEKLGIQPVGHRDIEYGAVWSRPLQFDHGPEIEFGFAEPSWAAISPIDPGTREMVMNGGCHVLYDPDGILSALCAAVREFGMSA